MKTRASIRLFPISAVLVLMLGLGMAFAQDALIRTRPLTPQEISDLELPADTRKASGTHAVGIGQPAYLEVLVPKDAVVNQVDWSLDAVIDEVGNPVATGSTITNSPLDLTVPIYDSGDREDYDVVSRKMLIPEASGKYFISAAVDFASTNVPVTASNVVVGSIYLGKDQQLCLLCHANKMDDFNLTGHAQAFRNQINGFGSSHFREYCISCHSVGYDTDPRAVNDGFDDVALATGWTFPDTLTSNNWDAMPVELQMKSNIQCENCHGPADEHMRSLADTERIGLSLSGGDCGQCHDAEPYHVKNIEWGQSAHAIGHYAHHYVGRSPCQNCHNGAGFVMAHDPDYADKDIRATGNEGISCATCHDPHQPGYGPHQLREMDGAPLGNGTVITAGGSGILCMNCHQSRRDGRSYVDDFDWGPPDDLNTFRGPHHGPQGDMIAGENAYEFGLDLPGTDAHLHGIGDSCVTCHMQDPGSGSPAQSMAGGHTWKMAWDGDSPEIDGDDVHLVGACAACHGEIEDFNIGGEDWDRDGMVEGTQYEIEDLLHIVESLLPAGSPNPDWTTEQLGAYYNLHFVHEDGSHGVHNPKYAAALLQASRDALTGGIDVDRDGLLDSWEIEQFGDLTSQSGDDDYDGDELTNAMEFSLGTKPKVADSDGDGYNDRVEIEGYSDPLDAGSVPDPDMVTIEPAVELGYLSTNLGAVVQFQSIDALNGIGGWMDTGPVHTNHGDWVFQLETLREATNRFYRVLEEE